MEQLCSMLDVMFHPGHEENDFNVSTSPAFEPVRLNTSHNYTSTEHSNVSDLTGYQMDVHYRTASEAVRFYIITIIIPIFCITGILGNACNILVVSKQRTQAPMDKSAYAVLIALAISDMICCISLLPNGFKGPKQNFFQGTTFWLLFEVYGIYVQNVFGHISTWFIVIVGISRHIAIVYPFTSREIITLRRTIIAMVIVTISWLLLDLPYIWSYRVSTIRCVHNNTGLINYYSLDLGFLNSNHSFNRTFTCSGIILGFLIPVAALCYCTFSLVKGVKSSQTLQKQHSANRRESTNKKPATSHVTLTLVTIVIVFIILILPSECLQVWYFFSSDSLSDVMSTVAVICNAFHTLHYAINFILYSVVNSQFRKTVMDIFLCRGRPFRNHERSLYQTTVTNCSLTSL